MFRCLLPSTGSLGLVPPLPWYCKALRLPATLPALLRFLRFAVPPLRLGFRSRRGKTLPTAGQGLFTGIPHTGFIDGDDRTSQVPGGPLYERALLFDPGGVFALGHYRASMLPSANTKASASAISIISGLNHTARSLAVYASQGELPHRHARLASGWLASLSGRELVTRWVPMKGFRFCPFSFPRLRLAH